MERRLSNLRVGWPKATRAARPLLLIITACLLGVSTARAVTLPAATFLESVSTNVSGVGAVDLDPSAPGSLPLGAMVMNGNGSADLAGLATTAGGARPTLAVGAIATGGASFQVDAFARIRYSFAVSGPASATPVPLLVTYSGLGAASGPVADGLGSISIQRVSLGTTVLSDVLGVSSVFGPLADSFGGVSLVLVEVDQRYDVLLEGTARAQANGGVSESEVTIDPLIIIDPSFANAGLYQVLFSENVATPAPAAQLLVGLGLAAAARRRRAARRG